MREEIPTIKVALTVSVCVVCFFFFLIKALIKKKSPKLMYSRANTNKLLTEQFIFPKNDAGE